MVYITLCVPRGYVGTNYLVSAMCHVPCRYVPCGLSDLKQTSYVLLSTCDMLLSTPYMDIHYVLYGTSYTLRVMCYEVRVMWISLYDSPPLVSFQGLFSFRKWFCFLELKIKNGWQFHFWNSNFSGKGNRGKYLKGCYFLGYIIIRCQCDKVARLTS